MRARIGWITAFAALTGCASAPPRPGMRVDIPVPRAHGNASRAVAPPTREPPPPAGPRKEYQVPKVSWSELPSGLGVGVIESHDLPIVELRVVVRAGSASEGAKYGLAALTAEWLRDGGAGRLSGREVLRQAERLGATLDARVDGDSAVLSLSVLKDDLEPAMALLAQVVSVPRFDAGEFAKLKRRAVARAANLARGDGQWSAATSLARALYGSGPYSHLGATSAEIGRLAMEDCRAYYKRRYVAQSSFVVIAGDVDPSESRALAERAFASFGAALAASPQAEPGPSAEPDALPNLSVTLIDRPSTSQSDIYVGMLGPSPRDEGWAAYTVANQVLGGSQASRLFRDVREASSLAYRIGSAVRPAARGSSMFTAYAGTQTAKTGLALKQLLAHVEQLATAAPSADEIRAATSSLSDSLAVRLGTVGAVADRAVTLHALGLPDDYDARYKRALEGLDASGVEQAARAGFSGRRAIVVAGDAKVIGPMLSHFGEVLVVDPADDFAESRRIPRDPDAMIELPRAPGQ